MATKRYVKPQIIIEDFTIDTNVAGDCERTVGNPSKSSCAVIGSGGIHMFSDKVDACDFESPTDEYDGFCYHIPTEKFSLFNS